jgi:tRNA(adenine34) deaminase
MNRLKPTRQDIEFIDQVLFEANKAIDEGKAGVGAMLTFRGEVLALGHNTYEETHDGTAHGEITILRKAAERLYEMTDSEKSELCMYVTLEPCLMCMSAMSLSGIKRVVYSALSEDAGIDQWIAKNFTCRDLNSMLVRGAMELIPGVRREAGIALLKHMEVDKYAVEQ